MNLQSLHRTIMGKEAGSWSWPVRGALRAGEMLYAPIIALRNAYYDRTGPKQRLAIPVISVGNLTVGGTGKTPFVIALVTRLQQMGRRPAVVSRGYKAAGDTAPLQGVDKDHDRVSGDEERLIRRHCPGVVCVSNPDRGLAGERAHRRFQVDCVVLDDGFQHRRLARCLDFVLIDATCPFGYDHLLPRGLLREPVDALRRAHAVVVTRADQVSPAQLGDIEARLRRVAAPDVLVKCQHRVTSIETLDPTTISDSRPTGPSGLEGRRVVLFAGIGRPQAFEATVRALGATVVAVRWWPDHYRYRARDIDRLTRPGRFPPYDFLVTTEKDAVKLWALDGVKDARILFVKVVIDFLNDGDTMVRNLLEQSVARDDGT